MKSPAYDPCLEWPNSTSLVLTSQLLTRMEDTTTVNNMLQEAAVVAIRMPKLRITEIWNRDTEWKRGIGNAFLDISQLEIGAVLFV